MAFPQRRILATIVALAALLLMTSSLSAQHTITRRVVGAGGGTSTSGTSTLQGTVSQGAIGRIASTTGTRNEIGFWYSPVRAEVATIVSLPHTEAEPGTRLTIPLHLTIADAQIPFLPRAFHARIRYNHTLLHPIGSTPACSYDGNDCMIEVSGVATSDNSDLATLEFVAALGDSERTALTIDEFTWNKQGEEKIAVVKKHGEFELLGVCRVGGEIRLIHSGAFASRVAAWPNPAREHLELEYVAAESGPVTITLTDALGREVAVLVRTDVEAQRLYRTKVDLSQVSSGSYLLTYSTPTRRITQPVLIAQ